MITLTGSSSYLLIPTSELEEIKRALEGQIMYHEAAEGRCYWAEKQLLANVKKVLRSVNEELTYRRKIAELKG